MSFILRYACFMGSKYHKHAVAAEAPTPLGLSGELKTLD